jgi:hypothetical protein
MYAEIPRDVVATLKSRLYEGEVVIITKFVVEKS